jgi:hypothetical protein
MIRPFFRVAKNRQTRLTLICPVLRWGNYTTSRVWTQAVVGTPSAVVMAGETANVFGRVKTNTVMDFLFRRRQIASLLTITMLEDVLCVPI